MWTMVSTNELQAYIVWSKIRDSAMSTILTVLLEFIIKLKGLNDFMIVEVEKAWENLSFFWKNKNKSIRSANGYGDSRRWWSILIGVGWRRGWILFFHSFFIFLVLLFSYFKFENKKKKVNILSLYLIG